MDIVYLLVTDGPMQGHRFVVKSAVPVIIGRGTEVTVHIPYDSFCSRKHAQIFYNDKKYYLEDLKSTNGTYLNDVRIEAPVELKNNDKIKFGNTEAVFLAKEKSEQPGVSDEEVFLGD